MFNPQMYPMNWIILFILFTMTFLMFMTQIYFNFKLQPTKKSKATYENNLNYWNKFW